LLGRDAELARLRFKMVPAKVSEETFWAEYFREIIRRIVNYVHANRATVVVSVNAAAE